MIEPYGKVVFHGDVQTPAIKASSSSKHILKVLGIWIYW